MALLDRMLHIGEGRQLKRLQAVARQVNSIEDDYTAMSDEDLRGQTADLRQRYDNGESLDSLMPEAFATVREASTRVLDKRHFDVQIMGGAALHWCNIAEMKTGEGKTLVGVLPSYLNALTGRGVHIVTVNDYLAQFQSEQMGRIHHFLGLEVGAILAHMDPPARRAAYNADITYGTNNEFGFDYLRDNMALSLEDCVQRGHYYAIVDEVDSILVDEARTPLIISGPAEDTVRWYPEFARLVKRLQRDNHYEVDEKKRTVAILEEGIAVVEDRLGIDNLYESENTPLISYLNNAIKAKELFKRDKDYVVMDGNVLIVDEHTGRTLDGRRYNEGLHQALEAKEGVQIKEEYQTLATITLQNFFRMYDKLAGMTGTAKTEESEFQKIYGLGVIPIPTNKPMIRLDQRDFVYKGEEGKFDAVVADIVERHAKGQPVLVGTVSVEKSEYLSSKLKKHGVPHEVLNAKQHEREAAVVAQAGRKGAVTVATNMAGRGTDIMLGGNAEFMAVAELAARGLDPAENAEEYEAAWPDALAKAKEAVAAEHEEVVELGGLYVLGTERHESRRIDNQLRGRSGRQGDPGESRFYLSMQDDLMRLFNSSLAESMMTRAGFPEDMPLESKIVTRGIQSAQSQVEARNFEIRKNVLKYDDVMSRQREVIYEQRRRVLEGEDLEEQIAHFRHDVLSAYIQSATAEGRPEDWDLDTLWTALRGVYPISITPEEVVEAAGGPTRLTHEVLEREVLSDVDVAYADREEQIGSENMRQLERRVTLAVLDRRWREHLYEMDYLKEGIGLRAMAQRDPLVEYQREGFQLFGAMTDAIKEETVQYLFNLEVQVAPSEEQQAAAADGTPVITAESAARTATGPGTGTAAPARLVAKGLDGPDARVPLQYSAPSTDGDGGVVTEAEDTAGRRSPASGGGAGDGSNREARRKAAKQGKRRR